MSIEILAVLIIMLLTILLLVFEIVRNDLVAVLCMLALAGLEFLLLQKPFQVFPVMLLPQ